MKSLIKKTFAVVVILAAIVDWPVKVEAGRGQVVVKKAVPLLRKCAGKVTVDKSGKQNGRGAYLKKDLEVVDMARKTKALEKYLEVLIPEEVYEELEKAINK